MKTTGVLFMLFLLILMSRPAVAQKENNVWAFGNGLGIDFNTPSPTLISTAIYSKEGCASICDTDGNLLFYSNGINVWNNAHTIMPNGSGLSGDASMSSTMGVAITAIPDNPNLYFLFTLDSYEQKTAKLHYSLIDMSLNGGKGDIVSSTKNIELAGNMSEKMMVASSCNGVWLITHHKDSALFYAYKITSTSIPAPVISFTPGKNYPEAYFVGEMKISSDFKRIAIGSYTVPPTPIRPSSFIEIMNFDNETGIVSGYTQIDAIQNSFSLEFSPNGSKLYLVDYPNSIYQYDLLGLPSAALVYASKFLVTNKGCLSVMRGPDGKIYLANGYIGCINNPDVGGAGCNVEFNLPVFKSKTMGCLIFGNNTARQFGTIKTFTSRWDTAVCIIKPINYVGNDSNSFHRWNDGIITKDRTFTTSGLYWLTSYRGCDVYIDTVNIKLSVRDTTITLTDTVICFDKQWSVLPSKYYLSYVWSDGSTDPTKTIFNEETVWVTGNDGNCQINIDTFRARFVDFAINLQDTVICKNEAILLDAGIPNATRYLWSNNSTMPTLIIKEAGSYWVEVSVGKCIKKDYADIGTKVFEVSAGPDTSVCIGNNIILRADLNNVQYLWQNGSTSQTIDANMGGVYIVKVTEKGCSDEDTVIVKYLNCTNCLKIPNAFSPNNDGRNEVFRAITNCPVLEYSMIIVNRYGQPVFQSNDITTGWDGLFNNQEQEMGVYYYLINARFDFPGAQEEIYKGDITLIR